MRVCGSFPNSPARATTVLGLEHFRATADGGVLALSFVTALLARPWKVGVRVRITCGNVPGAAARTCGRFPVRLDIQHGHTIFRSGRARTYAACSMHATTTCAATGLQAEARAGCGTRGPPGRVSAMRG